MIARISRIHLGLLAALLWLSASVPAHACAVCGGDKDSDLVKGALTGVIVMVMVTYGLLMSFVALGVSWFVRARRIARVQVTPPPGDGPSK